MIKMHWNKYECLRYIKYEQHTCCAFVCRDNKLYKMFCAYIKIVQYYNFALILHGCESWCNLKPKPLDEEDWEKVWKEYSNLEREINWD